MHQNAIVAFLAQDSVFAASNRLVESHARAGIRSLPAARGPQVAARPEVAAPAESDCLVPSLAQGGPRERVVPCERRAISRWELTTSPTDGGCR